MIDKIALIATCLFIVALATWPPEESSSKPLPKIQTDYMFENQMDSLHKIDDKLDIQILNTVKKAIKSHDRKH